MLFLVAAVLGGVMVATADSLSQMFHSVSVSVVAGLIAGTVLMAWETEVDIIKREKIREEVDRFRREMDEESE